MVCVQVKLTIILLSLYLGVNLIGCVNFMCICSLTKNVILEELFNLKI